MRRWVALGVLVAALVTASGARAEEEEHEAPSPVLLGAGIAVAVGGGALAYTSARKFQDGQGSYGYLVLNSLGDLVMQVGGAVETVWAWQLGQHRLTYDLRGNLPLRSRGSLATGALVVGAAAVVAMYVGVGIVYAKEFSCLDDNPGGALDSTSRCLGDTVMTSTIINLAAGGVLLVAAPIVGYGFGYDAAARDAGRPVAWLRPTVVPGGAGLSLTGRF